MKHKGNKYFGFAGCKKSPVAVVTLVNFIFYIFLCSFIIVVSFETTFFIY